MGTGENVIQSSVFDIRCFHFSAFRFCPILALVSTPETNPSEPDPSQPNFRRLFRQAWVAGYPPWYSGWLVKQAGCKTEEEGNRLLHLMRSIEDGKPEETRKLLEGIDPKTRLSYEVGTLLEWATEKAKHPDCIRVLLQAGADPNSARALSMVVSRWRSDLLADFLRAGVDPNLSFRGHPPLFFACGGGIIESVRVLLNAGVEINSEFIFEPKPGHKIKNLTPLMVAGYGGHLPLVKFLIESGADIHRADSDGNNAVAWAQACYSKAQGKKIVEFLKTAGIGESAPAKLGLPQRPDFSERAKSADFKKALALARKITGSASTAVQLAEGPLPGAKAFSVKQDHARQLLDKIRPPLHDLKVIAFISENITSFNESCIILLPTLDFYEAIAAFETPVGQSISSDDLIRWLKDLQKEQPFEITHIAPDLLCADFTTPIQNPSALAKSIEKICGDVINEPIEKVADALARSRKLYLWWD